MPERLACARVVREPQIAANNVLEEPDARLLEKHSHHVAEHGPDREKALRCGADVV